MANNDDEYLYEGMTIYHLGYLQRKKLISTEFKELGILPYYPEFESVIEDYLREKEGALTDNRELTPEASQLFNSFLSYDECFWGVLILDGYEQEIILDIDQELIDANLDVSIPSKPRVFFKACIHNGVVSLAVRSGDGVSITQRSSQRGGRHAAAVALMDMCDPSRNFSSPKSLEAVSQSKVQKVLDGEGFGGFFKCETIAHAEVVRSTASDNVTKDSVVLMFKDGGQACCIASGIYIDRSRRSWFYSWNAEGVEEALDLLSRSPLRDRIDLA